MKVLITGATGFVGMHIIPQLLGEGYEVKCLVRNEKKAEELKRKYNIEIHIGDVTEPKSIKNIAKGIDYVIHLAAVGHVSAVTEEAYNRFVNVNEIGTRNLINEFLQSEQLKLFVHFSSTAAMGPANESFLSEKSIPNPQTPYQRSKQRSEQIVLDAFKRNNFPGIILRPCMIYGPGGYGEFYKFCKLMKKGMFPKVGFGKNLTPLVYVKDVSKATELALINGRAGEIYIIASKESIELEILRKHVMNNVGKKPVYIFVPKGLALIGAKIIEVFSVILKKEPIVTYRNMKSTVVDRTFIIEKAENELKYKQQYSFEEGISNTIRWYKNQGKI